MLLCFFVAFDERLEEAHLRGRQGLRPHGHGLDVFLERFVFCKSVFFYGAVEDLLGFCGFLAFFLICDPRLHLRRQPSVLSLRRLVRCTSSAPVSGTRPWFAACGPASCVECS